MALLWAAIAGSTIPGLKTHLILTKLWVMDKWKRDEKVPKVTASKKLFK
ncbi:hypothetical protein IQ231_17950 [Cuspidothrix issatschenkoi LEGE 03284]|nr:hypothetical protein [Cuspidothrix issatschenkoi]MBE9233498.1 hypothetical protein [Cuspidothrix issatschenkoi LEGE 03284]